MMENKTSQSSNDIQGETVAKSEAVHTPLMRQYLSMTSNPAKNPLF